MDLFRASLITWDMRDNMRKVINEVNSPTRCIIYLTGVLLAHACTDIKPDYEDPAINVKYFRALPADGMALRFEIGLHIINPNDFDLDIRGISYAVSIQGQRILLGAASNLPAVPAYGEGDIDLQASTDVISSIKLLAGLINERRQGINYQLDAKLDIRGFGRKINVIRKGEFSFSRRE